mgnify:CR=1 FL=1
MADHDSTEPAHPRQLPAEQAPQQQLPDAGLDEHFCWFRIRRMSRKG